MHLRVSVIMVGKAKWKLLELPISRKISNKSNITALDGVPGSLVALHGFVHFKDLKVGGVMMPTTPCSTPLFGKLKTDGS